MAANGGAMRKIFVSYRRADSQGWAGRLGEALAREFGDVACFFDIESIAPGDDFTAAIGAALASSETMLVLIGPHWLSASFPDGSRRLDDPQDFVRIEIATGLARRFRVIPVLVGGASMPREEDMPEAIADLAVRQAFDLSDTRWDYDCNRLFDALERTTSLKRIRQDQVAARDEAVIRVGEAMTLEGVTAGDLAGVKGSDAAAQASVGEIEVLKGAKISGSKVGDIVGVKTMGTGRNTK